MIPICILAIEDDSDREFMSWLYQQYHRLMYWEIYDLLHDQWATEDILQNSLIKLINKIPALREKDRNQQVNYIIATCRNTAKNYLRDTKRHAAYSFDEGFDLPDDQNSQSDIEWRLIHAEDLQLLSRVFPRLDEKSRYLLEARYMLDMSPKEIAAELNIQANSVRMLLSRARKKAFMMMQQEQKTPSS